MRAKEQIKISLMRKKVKNLTLLGIITILLVLSILSFLILSGTNKEIKDMQNSMENSFRIELKRNISTDDPNAYKQVECEGQICHAYIGPRLDEELINKISKIKGVTSSNYEYYVDFESVDNFKLLPGVFANNLNGQDLSEDERTALQYFSQIFALRATTNLEENYYFNTGAISVIEGESIVEEDTGKVVISDELAEANKLKVGDTIKFCHLENANILINSYFEEAFRTPDITGEIKGIFHFNGSQGQDNNRIPESEIMDNCVFADLSVLDSVKNSYQEVGIEFTDYNYDEPARVTIFIDNSYSVDRVVEKVKEILGSDQKYFTITKEDLDTKAATSYLKIVKILFACIFLITIVFGIVLLSLMIKMQIQERKREIGIFLSLGISKSSIIKRVCTEYLIIVMLSGTLAAGLTKAGYQVVEQQIVHILESNAKTVKLALDSDDSNIFSSVQVTKKASVPESLQVSFDGRVVLLLFGVFSLEILLVTKIQCKKITDEKPRDIFTIK